MRHTRRRVHRLPVAAPDLGGNEERYVVDAIRSSWISSTSMARVGHAHAASRSFSSSTLLMSATSTLRCSPAFHSNAVGARYMQLPAPMQRERSTWTRSMARGCPP